MLILKPDLPAEDLLHHTLLVFLQELLLPGELLDLFVDGREERGYFLLFGEGGGVDI